MPISPRWPSAGATVIEAGLLERRELRLTDIESILPHRGYALFPVSCWMEPPGDHMVRGGGNVVWSASHPMLMGHFPGFAIVPGVFLIEAIAQIAGVLIGAGHPGGESSRRIGVLSSVKKALIHSPVLPDQAVRYVVDIKRAGELFFQVSGVGWVRERKAVTADMSIGLLDRPNMATL